MANTFSNVVPGNKYLIVLICNKVCNHRPSTGQDQPGQHLAKNNDDGDAGDGGDGCDDGDDGDDSDDDDDVDDSDDDGDDSDGDD